MLECDADTSVPYWVIEYPETLPIFDELEIDSSCAGKSLAFACIQQGLDVEAVLSLMRGAIESHRGLNGSADTNS